MLHIWELYMSTIAGEPACIYVGHDPSRIERVENILGNISEALHLNCTEQEHKQQQVFGSYSIVSISCVCVILGFTSNCKFFC